MIRWPHGSVRIPVDQLEVGDIVVVPGAGAYRIGHLVHGPGGRKLALLDWDDLALILRPGGTRECLNPAPHAAPFARRASGDAGVATSVRPVQHRLAG
ncbi:MAG: hypothetical protein GEV09_26495 [Pseudonocardiaceae bacterium]|nr:hypothetical protein [Pseudonocardiaceae bacterium]